ncbi:MAG: HNH endonuclease signature motif containing protein [Corynebacterium sp.]|uniref:HNH endonuclease signature motif containing protein n=1 Tax=Corynebacterium sp. TaxID=1720 RepID=UPI0026DDA27E|nr:HNH endonuclease signature motif containing protein [Corynebacterium sp.]MDO5030401.1 HNH endonuclease signature motif containing protein [Corynebacterium sp.]
MTVLGIIASLASRGMDTLAELHAVRPDGRDATSQLAADLGLDPARLRLLLRVADHYLSPADTDENTAAREHATALARRLGLSLDTCVLIDKRSRQANNSELHDGLRLTFVEAAERLGYEELDLYMRETLTELNTDDEPPQHLRARFSRKVDIRGMKHFHITGPAGMMDDLLSPLTVRAAEIRKAHPEFSHDRCVGQALEERLEFAGVAGPVDKLDEMRYQPAIIITAQDIVDYSPRYAATTNGSALAPDVFVNALLADTGWAVLYDEHNAITDLFPLGNPRLATESQRIAMLIDNPLCAWPGCNRPAYSGQAHHLVAHKHGGETTLDNLTMVCREHNALNDDDREGRNGHLERIPTSGHVRWRPPDKTRPPLFSNAFVTSMSGRSYAGYRSGTIQQAGPEPPPP